VIFSLNGHISIPVYFVPNKLIPTINVLMSSTSQISVCIVAGVLLANLTCVATRINWGHIYWWIDGFATWQLFG